MNKVIVAAFITLVVGLLTMAVFPETLEIGLLVAIVVMGAFIIKSRS